MAQPNMNMQHLANQERIFPQIDGIDGVALLNPIGCVFRCNIDREFILTLRGIDDLQYRCREIVCRHDDFPQWYLCTVTMNTAKTFAWQAGERPVDTGRPARDIQFTMRRDQWQWIDNFLRAQRLADLQHTEQTEQNANNITVRREITNIWSFPELTDGEISSDNTDALISITSLNPYLVQLT